MCERKNPRSRDYLLAVTQYLLHFQPQRCIIILASVLLMKEIGGEEQHLPDIECNHLMPFMSICQQYPG